MASVTLRLTERDVPNGSIIGALQDVHIPHHDEPACQLAIECMEDIGVTHVVLNGDIADCGPASRHEGKKKRAVIDEGDLKESIAPGYWIYEWARTRQCYYILGNHEAWVEDYITASPEARGTATTALMGLWADGDGWRVLPNLSRVRIGAYVYEHGNGFFPKGSGGENPWMRIRKMAPDQITNIGHLHREFKGLWTSVDEHGVSRTRGAFGSGHMSDPTSHEDYMGSYTNWQQGFSITRVWYDGKRPRFTTDQIEIHRTKRGRPIFEYRGKVYGR